MRINTCSGAISFAKELENESAKSYQALSQKYPNEQDVFLSFVRENQKNVVAVERAYYGVITDAIEGCFAFDMNSDEYAIGNALPEPASHSQVLGKAVEMEEKIVQFYLQAAEQSKFLLADVPRAFAMVVKKRGNRIAELRSLMEKEHGK